MSRRIGLYGGTFDPIHFGHLQMAGEMMTRHRLDEVRFVPAYVSPDKVDRPPTDAKHRLAMVRLAIEGIPGYLVDEREIERGGPSYTVDTVRALGQGNFFLIVSDEVAAEMASWKEIYEILEKTTLLVGRRTAEIKEIPVTGDGKVDEAIKKGYTPMPVLDIRATTIRERIKNKESCRHLVPAKVLAYVYGNQLYTL